MKWLNKIIEIIKNVHADPCKDPRCRGCAHIDGLICPYPKECSAMLKLDDNEKYI